MGGEGRRASRLELPAFLNSGFFARISDAVGSLDLAVLVD